MIHSTCGVGTSWPAPLNSEWTMGIDCDQIECCLLFGSRRFRPQVTMSRRDSPGEDPKSEASVTG